MVNCLLDTALYDKSTTVLIWVGVAFVNKVRREKCT